MGIVLTDAKNSCAMFLALWIYRVETVEFWQEFIVNTKENAYLFKIAN